MLDTVRPVSPTTPDLPNMSGCLVMSLVKVTYHSCTPSVAIQVDQKNEGVRI